MKLTTLLILCIPLFTYAQSYQPFPTENAAWKEYRFHQYAGGGGTYDAEEIKLHHKMGGDTAINNLIYKRIYYSAEDISSTGFPNYTSSTSYYNDVYVGSIRENLSRQIFVVSPGETNEMLLYDFNLEIGDTISSNFIDTVEYPEAHFTVESIDSVLVLNEYHKTYIITPPNSYYTSFTNNFDDLMLIEGIGSSLGLFQFRDEPNVEHEFRLECFQKNNLSAYPNGDSCMITFNVDIEDYEPLQVSLSPNPTTDVLELKIDKVCHHVLINIYRFDGQLLNSIERENTDKLVFRLDADNGIYLIETILDGQRSAQKIVKI